MVKYKCVGYGVTDSSGVATLNKKLDGSSLSPSYTATGAGKIDFVASVIEPSEMSSSSSQSVPYTVIDAIAYDKGIKDDPQTTNIWGASSTASYTRKDDLSGTLFNGNQWDRISVSLNNSINIPFNLGLVFEFVVVDATTGFRMNIYDGNAHQYTLSNGAWKIRFETNKVYIEKNGQAEADYSFDTTTQNIQFNFNTNISGFTGATFKEFKLYQG